MFSFTGQFNYIGNFLAIIVFLNIMILSSSVSLEDYPPMVMGILSGFLQQSLGPKKILQVTVLPGLLSWILVIINPNSTYLALASGFMAGLCNGLLTANVYAADMSSTKHRSSLKMVEVTDHPIRKIRPKVRHV